LKAFSAGSLPSGRAFMEDEMVDWQNLLKRIKEIFYNKLQAKTGWGKNEVMELYVDAVNEALIEKINGEKYVK
jgi:hypothetical protein